MPSYHYRARDKFGKAVNGIMGADSQNAIASKLAAMGYVPIVIEEAGKEDQLSKFIGSLQRVGFQDLNMFTRQLAVLQKAGLSILMGLNSLKDQASNKTLKDILGQVIRDIEGGSNLSAALAKHPAVFNALYVNMIKAGETGGRLDEALARLTVIGEHDEVFRMRVKSATRYPLLVVCAIIIGFIVLTTLVVPRFANIYSQFSTALPMPTQILLWINSAVTKYWWISILVLGALTFGFNKLINTKKGRFWWDGLILKVPVFGPLILKLALSRFARITGILMRSGVPLLKVLELAGEGTGNVVISRAIDDIRVSVNEGKGMTEPMKASSLFPPTVIQMVSVGEGTGKLDELLLHVADYYDSQVDYVTSNLATLIEPILILVLGCAVLFMALGIFLPMWNLMSLFRK